MRDLATLQVAFRDALLTSGASDDAARNAVVAAIADDAPGSASRLRIYGHHVLDSLTAVLIDTYPVVRRLVGPGFFAYAADAFIRRHPPASPRLVEYGDRFPAFLADFPACQPLAYLPDVARLEWVVHAAAYAPDARPLAPESLAALPPAVVGRAALRLDASLALLESPWPVERIWRANQPGSSPDATVDLSKGPARLQIRRVGDDVGLQSLELGRFVFRRALTNGRPLEAAAEAALAADPTFDLTLELRELFGEGIPVAVDLEADDGAPVNGPGDRSGNSPGPDPVVGEPGARPEEGLGA